MGKDKEMSKEELVEENGQLTEEVARLQTGLQEVQTSLQEVDTAYQLSKAAFSLARYGQLKDIIKKLISEESLKKVQSLTENQAESRGKGGGGMAGLLQKAREFGDEAARKEQPPPSAAAKSGGGRLSGFFKRLKQATGFSQDPPDIRCLDKADIQRDNERKRREVRRLTVRGRHALAALHKLHERYQASKKLAPPTRYQELKDMIKDVLAEQI